MQQQQQHPNTRPGAPAVIDATSVNVPTESGRRVYFLDDSDGAHMEQLVHVGEMTAETATLIESLARDASSAPSRMLTRLFEQVGTTSTFQRRQDVLSAIVHLKLYLDIMTNGAPLHNEAHRQFGLMDDYRQQQYMDTMRARTAPFFELHRAVQCKVLGLRPTDLLSLHYEMEYRASMVGKTEQQGSKPQSAQARTQPPLAAAAAATPSAIKSWHKLVAARTAPLRMTVTRFTQYLSDLPSALRGRIMDTRGLHNEKQRVAAYRRAVRSGDPEDMRSFLFGISSEEVVCAKSEHLKIGDAVTKGLLWHSEVRRPSSTNDPDQYYSNPLILGDLLYTREADVSRFLISPGGQPAGDLAETTLPVLHPTMYAFIMSSCVHYSMTSLSHFLSAGNGAANPSDNLATCPRWWCVFSGARINYPSQGRYLVFFFVWHPPIVCVISEDTFRAVNARFSNAVVTAGSNLDLERGPFGPRSTLEVDRQLALYLKDRPLVGDHQPKSEPTGSSANAAPAKDKIAQPGHAGLLSVTAAERSVANVKTEIVSALDLGPDTDEGDLNMATVINFFDDDDGGADKQEPVVLVPKAVQLGPPRALPSPSAALTQSKLTGLLSRQKRKIDDVAPDPETPASHDAGFHPPPPSAKRAKHDDPPAPAPTPPSPRAPVKTVLAPMPTGKPPRAAADSRPVFRDNYRAMDAKERALSRNAVDLYEEEGSGDEDEYKMADFEEYADTNPGDLFPLHPGLMQPGRFYKFSQPGVFEYYPSRVFGCKTKVDVDLEQDGEGNITRSELFYIPGCTIASRLIAALFIQLRQNENRDLSKIRETGIKGLTHLLNPQTDEAAEFSDAVIEAAGDVKNPWFVGFCQTRTLLRLLFFPKAQIKLWMKHPPAIALQEAGYGDSDNDDDDDGSGSGSDSGSGKARKPQVLFTKTAKLEMRDENARNLPWPCLQSNAGNLIAELINLDVMMFSNQLFDAIVAAEDAVLENPSVSNQELAKLITLITKETILLLVALFDV